jgi:hypothetical protein
MRIPSRVLSLQARKPSGVFGRYLMTKILNNDNVNLNAFAKKLIDLQSTDRIQGSGFGYYLKHC